MIRETIKKIKEEGEAASSGATVSVGNGGADGGYGDLGVIPTAPNPKKKREEDEPEIR